MSLYGGCCERATRPNTHTREGEKYLPSLLHTYITPAWLDNDTERCFTCHTNYSKNRPTACLDNITQTWSCSISSRRRCRSSSCVAVDGRLYRSGEASRSRSRSVCCPFVRLAFSPSLPAIDLAARRRRPPAAAVKTLIGTQPTAAAHDVDSFMSASFVHLL